MQSGRSFCHYKPTAMKDAGSLMVEPSDVTRCRKDGDKERPVIIHRAVLGSVERMVAILSENYAGKW